MTWYQSAAVSKRNQSMQILIMACSAKYQWRNKAKAVAKYGYREIMYYSAISMAKQINLQCLT